MKHMHTDSEAYTDIKTDTHDRDRKEAQLILDVSRLPLTTALIK